jgi:hypothetical protein
MKKMKKSILLLTAMFALVLNITVNAQTASTTATATASATIINPLMINKNSDLAFGNIASGSDWGSVTINTDGSRWSTGGATLIQAGSDNSAATFGITGYPYATIVINVTATSIQVRNGGNGYATVDNFNTDLGYYSTLDMSGNANLHLGATLELFPYQEPGYYTGSFDVIVSYN